MSEPATATPSSPAPAPRRSTGLVHVACAFFVVTATVVALDQLASLLQPLFIAVFFYFMGRPLARRLIAWRVPTFLANLAILFAVIVALLLLSWLVTAHIDDLQSRAPAYNQRFQEILPRVLDAIAKRVPQLSDELEQLGHGAISAGPLGAILKAVANALVTSLTSTGLFLIYLVFLNSEAVTLPSRLRVAYGDQRADVILAIGERIHNGIIRYVYVKGLSSALVAVLSTIALFAFGVELAALWGILIFFGNFIPYVGSFVTAVLPLVVALLQSMSLGTVATLALILYACQLLVENILEPVFASRQLDLSPLVVMFALSFWGWLWGVVGLIVAIPIMQSIKVVLENIPATRAVATLISLPPKQRPAPVPLPPATSDGTPGALP